MKGFHLYFAGAALLCLAAPTFADVSVCDSTPGNLVANCGFESGVYASGANSSVPVDWISNTGYTRKLVSITSWKVALLTAATLPFPLVTSTMNLSLR